ncbi:MAG TPA: fused MFS/spermidine synthase [Planctomycetota bacterium]|nr:fused MFS/spermidine synthase [Planctomycetota bacterium]
MPSRRGVFESTIFLGAFLLFQVQPLLSRWILPWFGGGTAVWTTCLLFFQVILFAGYAYAHASERLPANARTLIHLALIGAALAVLPLAPPETWKPQGSGNPTWPILKLLGATVGLPGLLLSSTGPLVQAWAARSDPGRSPYRLYALSNVGSLAALLSYPALVEPHWGLRTQSTVWTGTFAVYAALAAAGVVWVRRAPAAGPAGDDPEVAGWGLRLAWVLLPAAASALLLATTNQLGQDIAVLPFLWVLPLTVYLVSFIVVFDRPAWYLPQIVAPATALGAFAAALVYYARPTSAPALAGGIAVYLAAFFGACLLCHGELARLKPAPEGLTGYYLAVAGGGALGGVAVSVGAPLVFSTFFEWKLGMGLSYLAAWAATAWIFRGYFRAHLNISAGLVVVAGLGLAFQVAFLSTYDRRLESSRDFYGAVTVEANAEARDMNNGRVLHGRQYQDEKRRRVPNTYYVDGSGVGLALGRFRGRPDLRVGVVGLGTGTLATYIVQPTQSIRFYEINPEVPRIAKQWFTYLDDCPGKVEIRLGDARLSLEREPPQGFHVLALDAFSGHTVPTHLLTVEALKICLRHLREDGILAVHVSNQFLRLGPVARGAAHACGLVTLRIDKGADAQDHSFASSWMLCARNEEMLRDLRVHASEDGDGPDVVWSDDASDLFSILKPRPRS